MKDIQGQWMLVNSDKGEIWSPIFNPNDDIFSWAIWLKVWNGFSVPIMWGLAQSVAVIGWIGWIECMNTWWRGELFAFLLLFSLPSTSPPSTSSMPEHINSQRYIFIYLWIRYECITQRNQNHIVEQIRPLWHLMALLPYHVSLLLFLCDYKVLEFKRHDVLLQWCLTMGRCNHTCDWQLY